MWTLVKAWILKLVLQRSLGAVLAALLVILLPIAAVLKVVGIPLLLVLLIVGAPLLILLAIIGLPLLLIVGAGAAIIGVISAVLAVGVALLKVALPILLVVWLVRWFMAGRNGKDQDRDPGTGTEATPGESSA
ncbi:MAG: hypothetical protein ACT4PJ_12275 [Gemmatimonadaceae bacterium]